MLNTFNSLTEISSIRIVRERDRERERVRERELKYINEHCGGGGSDGGGGGKRV